MGTWAFWTLALFPVASHPSLHTLMFSPRLAHPLACDETPRAAGRESNCSKERSCRTAGKGVPEGPHARSPRCPGLPLPASEPGQRERGRRSTYDVSEVRSSDYGCALASDAHAQRGPGSQPRRSGRWPGHLHSQVHGGR